MNFEKRILTETLSLGAATEKHSGAFSLEEEEYIAQISAAPVITGMPLSDC